MVTPRENSEAYPFYELSDIESGSLNTVDEGYFDAPTMLKWQQRQARENGVEYIQNELTFIEVVDGKVNSLSLSLVKK